VNSTGNPAVMRRIFDEVINGKHRGGGGMREAFADLHEQFPDVRVEVESLVKATWSPRESRSAARWRGRPSGSTGRRWCSPDSL
jgi:hypothetical protein